MPNKLQASGRSCKKKKDFFIRSCVVLLFYKRKCMEMTITCLQYVEMPIVSRPDCQEDYSGVNGVDEGMICAGIDEGGGFW